MASLAPRLAGVGELGEIWGGMRSRQQIRKICRRSELGPHGIHLTILKKAGAGINLRAGCD